MIVVDTSAVVAVLVGRVLHEDVGAVGVQPRQRPLLALPPAGREQPAPLPLGGRDVVDLEAAEHAELRRR